MTFGSLKLLASEIGAQRPVPGETTGPFGVPRVAVRPCRDAIHEISAKAMTAP
jgi:hypothetical protein